MIRIGIDLGGTKTEAIVLDDQGQELFRKRVPTNRTNYESIVETVGALVESVEQKMAQKGTVGLGIPGSLSPRTGLIRNANSEELNGHPFDKDLSARLQRPVRVENDANCLAVSEASDGAGTGFPVVFAVIVGTGCGGGLVVNGKVITGANAIGGEWGHGCQPWMTPDEYPGPACYCGKKGCIETFISGTGFCKDFAKDSGEMLTGAEIVTRADSGDKRAQAAIDRYCDRMARALAGVMNILDPDVIVLGGGMSNVKALYEKVPSLLSRYAFSDGVQTPLFKAKHGDSSGVRGAAWLWTPQEAAKL